MTERDTPTDQQAPERIWLDPRNGKVLAAADALFDDVEYVRADIAALRTEPAAAPREPDGVTEDEFARGYQAAFDDWAHAPPLPAPGVAPDAEPPYLDGWSLDKEAGDAWLGHIEDEAERLALDEHGHPTDMTRAAHLNWLHEVVSAARMRHGASAVPDAELLDFIRREGYRRCDIPACNCGSWHGGHASDRLREIGEVIEHNGITILAAVEAAVSDRAELLDALEAVIRESDRSTNNYIAAKALLRRAGRLPAATERTTDTGEEQADG